MSIVKIYGKHAVAAAIANKNRKIKKIYTSHDDFIKKHPDLPCIFTANNKLSQILPEGEIHGGFIMECSDIEPISIYEFLLVTKEQTKTRIAVLDQVTDPHNIGAIIRSAVAFGFSAVIMTERNSPSNMATIARTSVGCLEKINVIYVTNLANTLDILKEHGYWVAGLDGKASSTLQECQKFSRLAFIMGSEGSGMRRLSREKCDLLVAIPIEDDVESLNVSNAAAIAFYEINKN